MDEEHSQISNTSLDHTGITDTVAVNQHYCILGVTLCQIIAKSLVETGWCRQGNEFLQLIAYKSLEMTHLPSPMPLFFALLY